MTAVTDSWQPGGFLDACAVYFAVQLVRCAIVSLPLTGIVMLIRKMIVRNQPFAKGMLWAVFLLVPFIGRLRLFYENPFVVRCTWWLTSSTMSCRWFDRMYMAGVLAGFLLLAGKRYRLRRAVAGMKSMYVAGRKVYVTAMGITPFTSGLIKPNIVLPRVMIDNYSEDELQVVVQHEQTHVRLGHLWCYFLWDLLRCLLWVNPLISLCQKYLRADLEEVCDKVCIQTGGKTANEYGRILLKSMKLLRAEQEKYSSAATYVGEKGFEDMKRRMEKIAGFHSYRKVFGIGIAAAGAVLVSIALLVIHQCSYARCSEMDNILVYQEDGVMISDDTQRLKQIISYDDQFVYVDRDAFQELLEEKNAGQGIAIVFGGFQKLPGFGGGSSVCFYEQGTGDATIRIPYEKRRDSWKTAVFKWL